MKRDFQLDFARGISLGAILLVNIELYFRPMNTYGYVDEYRFFDSVFLFLRNMFIQGKFLHLLAILLGFGLSFQLQKHKAAKAFLPRRAFFLLLVGVCHGLIWPGDILTFYSFIVIIIWSLRDCRTLTLFWFGTASFTISVIVNWFSLLHLKEIPNPLVISQFLANLSFVEFVFAKVYMYVLQQLGAFIWGWSVLSAALFGAYIQRTGYFPKSTWLFSVGVTSSLAFALVNFFPPEARCLIPVVEPLSSLIMPFFFIHLLSYTPRSWISNSVATIGRCGLSCYLSQSIVLSFFGTSYWWSILSKIPRIELSLIAITFFFIQIVGFHYWVARYKVGPAEWAQAKVLSASADD